MLTLRLRHYLSLNVMSSEKKGQGQGARAPFVIKVNVWQNPGLHTALQYTVHCSESTRQKAEEKYFLVLLLRKYKENLIRRVSFQKPAALKKVGQGQQIKHFNNCNAKLV